MGKLIVLIIIVVAGIFAYMYFTQPPNPADVQAKAQSSGYNVVKYWLECAKQGRINDMQAVTDPSAKNDTQRAMDELYQIETKTGSTYDEFSVFTMGAPNAYRAILSSSQDGILLQLTIRAEEKNGKFWIIDVTVE
ncbi:hypothetical protein J7M23_04260 [Candidatus Sumerlaeota bacterium]|nr:hypothetical protein [Candidatus Sumerlaeota bacterium]